MTDDDDDFTSTDIILTSVVWLSYSTMIIWWSSSPYWTALSYKWLIGVIGVIGCGYGYVRFDSSDKAYRSD